MNSIQKRTGEAIPHLFYCSEYSGYSIHYITHVIKRSVTVKIHCNLYLRMTENIAECFDVNSIFNCTGCKCMS